MILKVEFLAIRTKKQQEAAPVNQLEVTAEGIVGDRHFGLEKRRWTRHRDSARYTWIRTGATGPRLLQMQSYRNC